MNELGANRGRSITAVLLIGFGVLFLLGQIFNFSLFGILWPFFVIIPGAAFLYFALTGGKNTVGLAVPGSVVTGTGLILLYQSMTGRWESWAYAWTLYPVFVGLALTYMGERLGDGGTFNAGRGLVKWGAIAFVVAAAFFELVIFNGGGILGSLALPILLIGLGVLMLFGRNIGVNMGMNNGKRKTDDYVFTGPRVIDMKPKNGHSPSYSDDLQRKIDAAIAEDDTPVDTGENTVV